MEKNLNPVDRAVAEIGSQLIVLQSKMLERLGADFGTDSDEASLGYAHDPNTGATIVGIELGGLVYSLTNGELIVQRERGGRLEWAKVGGAGEPDSWRIVAPPRTTAASN